MQSAKQFVIVVTEGSTLQLYMSFKEVHPEKACVKFVTEEGMLYTVSSDVRFLKRPDKFVRLPFNVIVCIPVQPEKDDAPIVIPENTTVSSV